MYISRSYCLKLLAFTLSITKRLILFQPEVNMIERYHKMILDHMDTFGVVFYMNFAEMLVREQVLPAEEIPILDKMQPVELQHHISKTYLDLLAVREFDKYLKVNYKDLHLIFMQLADRSDEEDFCKLNQPGTAEESNVSRRKTSTPMRYVPREYLALTAE